MRGCLAEQDGHLRGDAAAAPANLVDAGDVRREVAGQPYLGDAPIVDHLLKDLTGMNGDWTNREVFAHRASSGGDGDKVRGLN